MLERPHLVQRYDCMDGTYAGIFDLRFEVMMSMRRSVQACDNCARDN